MISKEQTITVKQRFLMRREIHRRRTQETAGQRAERSIKGCRMTVVSLPEGMVFYTNISTHKHTSLLVQRKLVYQDPTHTHTRSCF